jgi:hypothetical protein
MDMVLERIKAGVAEFLRGIPCGATADVAEHTVVYLEGERVMGVHLCADYPGFDERFELDHQFCVVEQGHLDSWFAHPCFTVRPDLLTWLDGLSNDPHSGD